MPQSLFETVLVAGVALDVSYTELSDELQIESITPHDLGGELLPLLECEDPMALVLSALNEKHFSPKLHSEG